MAGGFQLAVDVIARIDNFSAGMRNVSRQAQSTADKLNSALGGRDPFANMSESIQRVGKDWQNITRGILISQFFYQAINGAQAAASAMAAYTDSINQARVAFGNLFGNYDLASEFVNVLQQYATRSPFNFQDVESAAKSLRAYGIQAENMMFVMQGIGNLAAVTGNYSETFNRVARAIGQINTKGKLMGEEMRQLAEAGLNVNGVYQRLGIEAGKVADANIDAATAINAIVDTLNADYGNAVAAANSTVQGLLANMKDLVLSVGSSIFQPIYESFHSMLYTIAQGMNQFAEIFSSEGLAAAISQVFGQDVLNTINNFLAILAQLGQSILQVLYPAVRILGQAIQALMVAFTPLVSVISSVLSLIGNLANFFLNNAAAMRVLQGVLVGLATAFMISRAAAIGMMVINVISKVISFFSMIAMAASSALSVMSQALAMGAGAAVAAGKGWVAFAGALNVNPLILAISVITALIAALVGLRSLLGGVSNVAANMSSFDPNNFLGSIKPASGDIGKFNNRLSDTNDQLNDMADGLGKAGKAAEKAVEGLLSFDEVFSLPDQNDPTLGGGGGGGIGDIGTPELPDLGGIGGGIPDVPLFDWDMLLGYDQLESIWGKIKSFFSNLSFSDIGAAITAGLASALSTIGIGNIITAFERMMEQGFAKVGWELLTDPNTWKTLLKSLKQGLIAALLTLGFEFVFDIIGDKLREAGLNGAANVVDKFASPFASALATAIVTKNPFAAVGAFVVSAIMQSIEEGINTGDWSGTVTSVAGGVAVLFSKFLPSALTTALGASAGGLAGGLLGFGGIIVGMLFDSVSQSMEQAGDTHGAEITSKFGTILSSALSGAGIGMIFGPVGAAVGAGIGGIIGTIMSFWTEISGWWNGTAWPVLQGLGAGIGGVFTTIGTTIQSVWGGITAWFGETWGPFWEGLSSLFGTVFGGIGTIFQDVWNVISTFFGCSSEDFKTAWDTLWQNVSTIASDIWDGLVETIGGFFQGIVDTAGNLLGSIMEIKDKIGEFFSNAIEWLLQAGMDLLQGLWNGVTEIWNGFWEWVGTVPEKIGSIFDSAIEWLLQAGMNILQGLWNGVTDIWNGFWDWIGTVPEKIGHIFSGAINWLLSAGGDILSGLWNGAQNIWNSVTSWFNDIPNSISNIFSGAWNWLTGVGGDIIDGLWSGLKSGWDWVCNQVSGWGSWLASIKGPESYDKRLLTPNGKWITQSLYKGLTSEFPNVLDAMSGLAPMMAEAFSTNSDDAIREANNYQPHNRRNGGQVTEMANPYLNTTSGSGSGSVDNRPIMYVGNLIANKQGLRELQKQLDVVVAENNRWR